MSFLTERYGDERENTMGLNKIAGEALTATENLFLVLHTSLTDIMNTGENTYFS